jgi:succinate dehydrogenase / fumarate reductase cytochrome b subunit
MANTLPDTPARRPEFRNIHALTDLPNYRLPAAGIVSILHRISGFVLFLLMPSWPASASCRPGSSSWWCSA